MRAAEVLQPDAIEADDFFYFGAIGSSGGLSQTIKQVARLLGVKVVDSLAILKERQRQTNHDSFTWPEKDKIGFKSDKSGSILAERTLFINLFLLPA